MKLDPFPAGERRAAHSPAVPVFGMFRSGTNYLRTVLERNYDCEVVYNLFGWKHGYFPIVSRESPIAYPESRGLFISKHPFHQLLSLRNYAIQNGRNLRFEGGEEGFMRSRLIVYDVQRAGSVEYRFANPVDFYNSMCWNYLSAARGPRQRLVHVDYHALTREPEATAEKLAATLGLTRTSDTFVVPENSTKNMPDRNAVERRGGEISEYTTGRKFIPVSDEEARAKLGRRDLHFILDNIDRELVSMLGYEI